MSKFGNLLNTPFSDSVIVDTNKGWGGNLFSKKFKSNISKSSNNDNLEGKNNLKNKQANLFNIALNGINKVKLNNIPVKSVNEVENKKPIPDTSEKLPNIGDIIDNNAIKDLGKAVHEEVNNVLSTGLSIKDPLKSLKQFQDYLLIAIPSILVFLLFYFNR